MSESLLTVRAIRAVAVEVPMRYVLGTSAAALRAAPLLLVDVETEEGVTGRTWLFCYVRAAAPAIVSLLGAVEEAVRGERIAPVVMWALLSKRFRLIGVQGIVRMAMAAFDTACWDALAIAANMPLAAYLGGTPRPVPAETSVTRVRMRSCPGPTAGRGTSATSVAPVRRLCRICFKSLLPRLDQHEQAE